MARQNHVAQGGKTGKAANRLKGFGSLWKKGTVGIPFLEFESVVAKL
jgi:hypothetical protein